VALEVHYTQAITPLIMLQTFADCECVAVPLHEAGGPGRFVMTAVDDDYDQKLDKGKALSVAWHRFPAAVGRRKRPRSKQRYSLRPMGM
jgi:hypothetical protein